MQQKLFRQRCFCVFAVAATFLFGSPAQRALSQTGENAWTPSLNLSNSGSASQPLVATAPDGTQHTLWWDKIDGTRYLRLAPNTIAAGTLPERPVPVPAIFGSKITEVNQQTGLSVTTLTAPREPRLVADANGRAHFFYLNALNQLLYSQGPASAQNMVWGAPVALGDAVTTHDINADQQGTLHLAFIRSSDPRQPRALPGLYYRAKAPGGAWLAPTLVYSSTYFRVDTANDLALSAVGDGNGNVIATWFQARQGQSWYAVSNNGGKTWTEPQYVSGSPEAIAAQTSVALAPDGSFLLVWRDAHARGCGLTQRRSVDGGVTWSEPVPILPSMTSCPPKWWFAQADNKLWFIGTARTSDGFTSSSVSMAYWDTATQTWSPSADLALTALDPATKRLQTLSCLNISLAGQTMGGVGCNAAGDVWAATNAINLNAMIQTLQVAWTTPMIISNRQGPVLPQSLTTTTNGNDVLYALWAQGDRLGTSSMLHFANWTNGVWTATPVINPPTGRATQPNMAFLPDGRVHAVWNSGQIYYSRAYARDANSVEGWSAPIAVPAPSDAASSPCLAYLNNSNTLLVAYAVPFNEKRGVYLTQSNDGGDTWTQPALLFDAVAAGWESIDAPQLAFNMVDNVLHAVWLKTVLPNKVGDKAVYYASSRDGGRSWSAPQEMAVGALDAPRVVAKGVNVAVVWNRQKDALVAATPFEVHYRFSLDGGASFTADALIPGFDSVSGPAHLQGDGAGHIYVLAVGQGTNSEATLLYSSWNVQGWIQRESFGLGQNAATTSEAMGILSPQGGKLMTLIRVAALSREGVEQFELIAAERAVDAAAANSPVEPAPVVSPITQAVSATTPTGNAQVSNEPTATPKPALPSITAATGDPGTGGTDRELVLFGSLFAVVGMGAVLLILGFKRSKRR